MSSHIGIGSGKVRVTLFRLGYEPVVSMSLPWAGGSSSPVRQIVHLLQLVASVLWSPKYLATFAFGPYHVHNYLVITTTRLCMEVYLLPKS
jgi:hypothetical protein